jgi:hypothetical protein
MYIYVACLHNRLNHMPTEIQAQETAERKETTDATTTRVAEKKKKAETKKAAAVNKKARTAPEKTHSKVREYILQSENTFYSVRTRPTARQRVQDGQKSVKENTFYRRRSRSTVREHILQ